MYKVIYVGGMRQKPLPPQSTWKPPGKHILCVPRSNFLDFWELCNLYVLSRLRVADIVMDPFKFPWTWDCYSWPNHFSICWCLITPTIFLYSRTGSFKLTHPWPITHILKMANCTSNLWVELAMFVRYTWKGKYITINQVFEKFWDTGKLGTNLWKSEFFETLG